MVCINPGWRAWTRAYRQASREGRQLQYSDSSDAIAVVNALLLILCFAVPWAFGEGGQSRWGAGVLTTVAAWSAVPVLVVLTGVLSVSVTRRIQRLLPGPVAFVTTLGLLVAGWTWIDVPGLAGRARLLLPGAAREHFDQVFDPFGHWLISLWWVPPAVILMTGVVSKGIRVLLSNAGDSDALSPDGMMARKTPIAGSSGPDAPAPASSPIEVNEHRDFGSSSSP